MLCPCYFNSRPSARGDGPPAAEQALYAYFNSRPSARGDVQRRRNGKPVEDFNSRPSARGDAACSPLPLSSAISIHAPPRGATSAHTMRWSTALFQFTPLREGRPYASREAAAAIEFQFTPLREGHFNSRPSARGDVLAILGIVTDPTFQFTPLREGRQQAELLAMHGIEFQFTPLREGRPLPQACHAAQRTISIHAPPRGATARVIGAPRLALISIHAPPRGATRLNFLKSS